MKAAFVAEAGKVEIREVPQPRAGDGEVLIRVRTAGVCGSDLHLFRGTHAFRKPPAVLGHEVAGDIIEVGKNVTGFRVGDRVTVEPHVGCGQCEFCRQHLTNLCTAKKSPGTPAWIGSFVEVFNAPAETLYKLDDSVSYEIGTLIEPLAVAVHAVNRITVREKNTLVILGSGTIGLMALVAAREAGYQNIICTDTQPFNLDMAMRHGAKLAVNPLTEDAVAKVREFTGGRGADVALVAADAKNIVDQASSMVRKRGEVGIIAMITEKIPVYTYGFVFNEQTLFGSMTYETKDFKIAADIVNGGLDLRDFVTQRYPLEESQKALDVLSEKKEHVVKVIVDVR